MDEIEKLSGKNIIQRYHKRFNYDHDYWIVNLPQPIACLTVMGLIKILKWKNLCSFDSGDMLIIRAVRSSVNSTMFLWEDEMLHCAYTNAVLMGHISETQNLPIDCFVGFVIVGEKTKNGYYEILEHVTFENIVQKLPNFLNVFNPYKPNLKDISLDGNTIKVPLSDEKWEELEKKKGTVSFYWKTKYDILHTNKNGFGNKNGLFEIVFSNREKEIRFVQDNIRAVTKAICKEPSRKALMALTISFENLKEKGVKSDASFSILQKKEWMLDWKCVKFKNGYIVVFPPVDGSVKFKPKAVSAPGSIDSFNYLSEYFNERLSPVHCTVEGMVLDVYDTIRLNEAIQRFATISRQKRITVSNKSTSRGINVPNQTSFNRALSKAKQMTLEEFEKYKSEYIDYLVKQQSKSYKIIPCVERLAHADSDITEYAFIFSIKCKSGDLLIIHENVHPDRSTLLFVVKPEKYNNAIRAIFDFMQSAEINKRSNLRDGNVELKQDGIERFRSINHDYFYSWSHIIKNYKEFYKDGTVWMIY